MDEALSTADGLKELIDKGMNKRAIRIYYDLMGRIEFERNRFSEAVEFFKKAVYQLQVGFYKHVYFIEPLALAYYKAGDKDEAQEEYERIISFTTGRFYHGDIYAKSFYRLGKIFEEQGLKAKAIEHYQKFLDL